jgi:hypothetical protein
MEKKLKFVFINDDEDDCKQWLQWAERKGYHAEVVSNVFDADRIRADFYVFDISAIAPANLIHTAYSPICTMINNHPGATFVIVSGISKYDVEATIEDVEDHVGVTVLNGGWGTYEAFEEAIKDYI